MAPVERVRDAQERDEPADRRNSPDGRPARRGGARVRCAGGSARRARRGALAVRKRGCQRQDEIERCAMVAGRRTAWRRVEERRRLEEAALAGARACRRAGRRARARDARVWRACASSKLKRRPNASAAAARPAAAAAVASGERRARSTRIPFRSPVSTATIDSSPRWRIAPSRITAPATMISARRGSNRARRSATDCPASRRRGPRSGASSAARRRAPRRSR